jgi:hypothetical protein
MREHSSGLGRGCESCGVLFVLVAMLLFGGAAGNWFAADLVGGTWWARCLQLAAGALVMGVAVSIPGSLFFGRNPIRWGMGMPVVVYFGGTLMALMSGRDGAAGLLCGGPLFIGLAIATGVMGAFLIDGLFPRSAKA